MDGSFPVPYYARPGAYRMGLRRGLRRLAPALLVIALAVAASLLVGAPGKAAQTPLAISIFGNHFVGGLNGTGQTIQLRGVNVSSSEYACAEGYGYDDGDYTDATAAAIAAWGANAVRIPLNEDCWLNINLPAGDPYGGAGYQQEIESFVSDLNAHGIYAILDLHWTAPGNQTALEQQPMPDMDHSPAFWNSVASVFKPNPAVLFDLFNEPYDPTDPRSGDDPTAADAVTWGCWQSGTKPDPIGGGAPPLACDTQAYDDNGNPTTRYQIAGMQTLVTDIRKTGATQPIIVGGLDYADDLGDTSDANGGGQGWMQHAPDDPLNQEAASFHNYQGKSCDNQTCWDASVKPVAANVPVVTGEFAEDNYLASGCNPNPGASTFDESYMSWADSNGVSYLAWVWLVDDPPQPGDDPCDRFGLLSSYHGAPLAPNGTAVHDHLTALASGTGTTTGPGTTGPTRKPPVRLRSFSGAVAPGGKVVRFRLRSPQRCSGRITGQTVNNFAVTAVKRKARKVSLGSVRFSLRAGKSKTVVLTLSRTSRTLLAAKRSLRVRFTITLNSAGHRRTVLHRTMTLRLKR
jgi:endoglucanase